jgi:S1-C subfamily serine protease
LLIPAEGPASYPGRRALGSIGEGVGGKRIKRVTIKTPAPPSHSVLGKRSTAGARTPYAPADVLSRSTTVRGARNTSIPARPVLADSETAATAGTEPGRVAEGFSPQTFAEQLFFVTARLEGKAADGRTWTATGFVYRVPIENDRSVSLLITNRHVVDEATEVAVRLIQSDGAGLPQLGRATQVTVTLDDQSSFVTTHPDPRVDVAAFPIQPLVNEMVRLKAPPYYKAISPDLLPMANDLDQLDAIEPLMFAGYPAGLFDQVNLTPVVRQGVAATPLQLDYAGLPAFLIDASVFPGSSGSPVFLTPTAFSVARSGGFHLGGRKPLLLGILAAVHAIKMTGVVTEMAGAFKATFEQPLNLGIVFKSRAIDDVADLALAEHGYVRKSPAPLESTPRVA